MLSQVSKKYRGVRMALGALALLDIALVLLGLGLYPAVLEEGGLLGASAAILMVCLYGCLALFGPLAMDRVPEKVWGWSASVGLAAGVWLGVDLLSNYFIYRDGPTNSKISLLVYGVYFLLLLSTALRGSQITNRFRDGLTAALWYIIPAQLIWFMVEFGAYYLFAHTPVGEQFIQTEMGADFVRSGGHNFQVFVIGDFFGAGFFHLLLIGLLAVLVIGSAGAGLGKLIGTQRKRTG